MGTDAFIYMLYRMFLNIYFYSEHRLLSFNHILKKTAYEFYEEVFKKENTCKEAWKVLNLLMTKKQYKM